MGLRDAERPYAGMGLTGRWYRQLRRLSDNSKFL